MKSHITSIEHKNNTPQGECKEYEELKKLFEEGSAINKRKELDKDFGDRDTKDYLEFVSFCISQQLSFCQVESIGKFLQNAYKDKKLKFLSSFNFDGRFMSKIVQDCSRPIIESDIKEKLANSPFSLIIDNSTFVGSNICALKVKYLDQVWQEELRSEITTVKNKIIASSDLDERSDGKTLKEIVENKLLNHKRIKKNLIGLAHDNASSLTSEDIGLASLLKKDDCHFFDR